MLSALTAASLVVAASCAWPARILPPPADNSLNPYPYLSDGDFTGPPLTAHPDPLGSFVWTAAANASELQVYYYLPLTVSATPESSFPGAQSLLDGSGTMTVSGAGVLVFDYGVETASWIEFDCADLASSDLAHITLSISEYNQPEVTNLGYKTGIPVAHARASGTTTYRLELPHPDLYEGVRFAFLSVDAAPSAPWHVTQFRLVAQVKPTNWGGSFSAPGDELLDRVWYAGAYTVKANLLSDQFGSILIYRGDRFSWTGDAHVAQATALAALHNDAFVLQNLIFTKENCNGIESYCLYYVLSVADYYHATGDSASMVLLAPHVENKLEHAHDVWGSRVKLGFYGWDDRLGSGFSNSTCEEAEAAYRSLAIRAWRSWAGVLSAVGNVTRAAHYSSYVDTAVAATRAPGAAWWAPMGLFSVADAINAGVATADEGAAIVVARMSNAVTICALSAFNTFYVLEAMAALGEVDRGLFTIHRCWDVMVVLGGTCVWETSSPDWALLLNTNDGVPGFEDGYTSLAHPWSSGATAWATAWLLGVRFDRGVPRIAPHISGSMTGVRGAVPVAGGSAVGVHARPVAGGAVVDVFVPASIPAGAELELSALLAQRLLGDASPVQHAVVSRADALDTATCSSGDALLAAAPPLRSLAFATVVGAGPVDPVLGARSPVARIALVPGCTRVYLSASGALAPPAAPPPFPPLSYPAQFLGADTATAGSWKGKYGGAGYYLAAYDGVNQHRVALPPFVAAITQAFGKAQNGPWPCDGSDVRALQDPSNASAPRKIGQWSVPPAGVGGWDPSYPLDVLLTSEAEGVVTYRVALYMVDFDLKGRRQAVSVMDATTHEPIAQEQLLSNFTGGSWLSWQYNRSMRFRFNYIRGDNQVVSAVMFDV